LSPGDFEADGVESRIQGKGSGGKGSGLEGVTGCRWRSLKPRSSAFTPNVSAPRPCTRDRRDPIWGKERKLTGAPALSQGLSFPNLYSWAGRP
jgi:hypothetical protein